MGNLGQWCRRYSLPRTWRRRARSRAVPSPSRRAGLQHGRCSDDEDPTAEIRGGVEDSSSEGGPDACDALRVTALRRGCRGMLVLIFCFETTKSPKQSSAQHGSHDPDCKSQYYSTRLFIITSMLRDTAGRGRHRGSATSSLGSNLFHKGHGGGTIRKRSCSNSSLRRLSYRGLHDKQKRSFKRTIIGSECRTTSFSARDHSFKRTVQETVKGSGLRL